MCLDASDTIDVSGRCTSAAIATSGAPWLRASISSGSYEIATSTLPAASSCSGVAGFDGTWTWTSRPASEK